MFEWLTGVPVKFLIEVLCHYFFLCLAAVDAGFLRAGLLTDGCGPDVCAGVADTAAAGAGGVGGAAGGATRDVVGVGAGVGGVGGVAADATGAGALLVCVAKTNDTGAGAAALC